MKIPCIDLHTHSTASDGTDSPAEVVSKAVEAGVSALALTDHDTLDGLAAAEKAADGTGLIFVRGCEISTETPWGEAHFLGLWIPRDPERTADLEKALEDVRAKRLARNMGMAEKLQALGFDVSYEAAAELAGGRW